jgi:hypothetical protein
MIVLRASSNKTTDLIYILNYMILFILFLGGGRHGCDRIVVGYITTCAINAYHH